MGNMLAPVRSPELPVQHKIEDLRHRREEPWRNFVLCVCGWRADGLEASDSFARHQAESRRARG